MAQDFRGQNNLPLGLRNNNPGNLRPGDNWQGMVGVNGGFIVFEDMAWGIRAFFHDLYADIAKGQNTIRKRVAEYAPASENDTEAYTKFVSRYTGIAPDVPMPLTYVFIEKLFKAHMIMENGAANAALIKDSDILEGYQRMNPAKRSFFLR